MDSNAYSNDLFTKDADSLMNQMTRLSLHPRLSAYPSKEDDAAMRDLNTPPFYPAFTLSQPSKPDRIREVAGAINIEQRLEASKEEWKKTQRLGDELKGKEVRDLWQGWMELLKWEMLVSEVEERCGLIAI
ncbi:hypothetical protein ONS95_005633 [Cadophora gregata]|uniref:uncharacterized protein n=1 Tax=Cadophora gregata TaxID=51156 RepID=UPI0026DAD3A3|nr:uncharacterized protein ONS95_005633 [Cadophora gregata]KAK0103621.1 hypothetical protein ONS95_005633 [Cadophora gregata]KAK0107815.1 hypothetical protein ONS96_003605 [Cadophora gregata f. sp. sojae]